MKQYEQVKRVGGVDVAAPIAMIGYVTVPGGTSLDVTDAVDRNFSRQMR